MRKSLKKICCLMLVSVVALTGCKTNTSQDKTENNKQEVKPETGILYSNLVDEETKNEVEKMLKDAGVSEDRIYLFHKWVQEMNQNIETADSFKSGFTYADGDQINYDNVTLNQEYNEDGSYITDMNCRLTSYLLMGQFINAKVMQKDANPYLMFDVEAIENEERFASFRDNMDKFITIFNPVKVGKDASLEEHVAAIQKEWEARGLTVEDNGKISFITLYLHDPDLNLRFVGHTGVLLEQKDGLVFIEKYGWNKPFQCTKFANQDELVHYLTGRGDLAGDGTEKPVIVMKNNTVISK